MAISVNRDPAEAQAALARAANKQADGQEAHRSRTAAIREKAKREAQTGEFAGAEPEAEADAPFEPREQIDHVEVELPRGQIIEFGPPSSVALTTKLLTFFGGRDPSRGEETITQVILCVRSINGRPVEVRDVISRDKIINEIGDDGVAILASVYRQYWPPATANDVKVIKKVSR